MISTSLTVKTTVVNYVALNEKHEWSMEETSYYANLTKKEVVEDLKNYYLEVKILEIKHVKKSFTVDENELQFFLNNNAI